MSLTTGTIKNSTIVATDPKSYSTKLVANNYAFRDPVAEKLEYLESASFAKMLIDAPYEQIEDYLSDETSDKMNLRHIYIMSTVNPKMKESMNKCRDKWSTRFKAITMEMILDDNRK